MDISNYLLGIANNITNRTQKKSISGATVGQSFVDLANLTKSAVEALPTKTDLVQVQLLSLANMISGGTVYNNSLLAAKTVGVDYIVKKQSAGGFNHTLSATTEISNISTGGFRLVSGITASDSLEVWGTLGTLTNYVSNNSLFLPNKNLFNPATATQGFNIVFSTGNLTANSGFTTSDFIPVSGSTSYARTNQWQMAFYNSGKTYISGLSGSTNVNDTFITPSGASFIRVSVLTSELNSYQLELGTVSTSYIAYTNTLINPNLLPVFDPNVVVDSGVIPQNYGFYLNPISTTFNYNAITRMEAIEGNYNLLLNPDGSYKQLYLTFMRFLGVAGNTSSTILQISVATGATVGVNNVTALMINDAVTNYSASTISSFTLTGVNAFAGLEFSVLLDVTQIPSSFIGSSTISNTLQLNTALFVEQLKGKLPLAGKKIVCFGDSVTEFGNYPDIIANVTGAQTYNIGFGGCRMGTRLSQSTTSLMYNQLAMYKIADTIASGNYSGITNAVNWLAANAADDNTPQLNRLTAIDFTTVDMVTIFYGTNDWSSGENTLVYSGSTDVLSLPGAMNYSLNSLLTAYPNLKVVFITPTFRYSGATGDGDSDIYANSLGLFLSGFCTSIETTANANHIPCLNLYKTGMFHKWNHSLYFGTDGVHPNTAGYAQLGQRIAGFITSLFKY